ncbi:MAG: lactonase family protein [Kiritimatiellae bacterium]|nr:lactonase family protein [Kiritimatiellia bacterium]
MKTLMIVGSYTNGTNAGIQFFDADTETGKFTKIRDIPETIDSTYFCMNRARTRLYAGLRDPSNPDKGKNGAVAAYSMRGDQLELLNRVSVGPVTPPCYVALDPAESGVVWAEYVNATYGCFALDANGALGRVTAGQNTGDGPNKPRQDKAHAHCSVVSPDGNYLCIVDLGIDAVKVFDWKNRANGLNECKDVTIRTAPGLGPRHFIFHPNGKLAFLVYELGNAVTSFRYDGKRFEPVQTISMLPGGFQGDTKAAAIKVSADGKRLFASNRGHNSIAVYDIDTETGALTLLTINQLVGKFPRDFTFMPGEKFLVVGHKMSNNLMTYAYDRENGTMTPLQNAYETYRPVCIQFV